MSQPVIQHRLSALQGTKRTAVRKHHPPGIGLCLGADHAHHFIAVSQALLQLKSISVPIRDRLARHTRFHRSPGDSHRNTGNQAGIHRLGNNILPAKGHILLFVHRSHHVGHRLLGQSRNSPHRSNLHFFIDTGGTYVQSPPENIGETQHIVHLVGMIGTAGGKYDIWTGRHGFLIGNLGIGIGQRKDNGIGGHGTDHLPAKHIALGKPQEHICSTDGFLQRVHRVGCSKLQLHGIHVRPGSVQHTLGIAHINMAGRHPQ